jgi:hypothetical protein
LHPRAGEKNRNTSFREKIAVQTRNRELIAQNGTNIPKKTEPSAAISKSRQRERENSPKITIEAGTLTLEDAHGICRGVGGLVVVNRRAGEGKVGREKASGQAQPQWAVGSFL